MQSVDINDNGDVVIGVIWQGRGAKNVHKFTANCTNIWSGSVSYGSVANKSMSHLPAERLLLTHLIKLKSLIRAVKFRVFSPEMGTVQCLMPDIDGYIYALLGIPTTTMKGKR